MAKVCGVYVIRCKAKGRFYYGSSADCLRRKVGHLRALRNGRHHSIYLQRVFNKYGEGSLQFFLVQRSSSMEEALKAEQKLLNQYVGTSGCMNVSLGAAGGDNLTFNPNRRDIIKKMSTAIRSRMEAMSKEERKEKYGKPGKRNGMFGRTHTKKTREKLSKAHKGKQYALGCRRSDRTKKLLSTLALLRSSSPDYINPFAGCGHSKSTREILSKAAKRRIAAGILPGNTLRVEVGKRVYRSLTEAAQELGCVTATVANRVRSKNFPEYRFI